MKLRIAIIACWMLCITSPVFGKTYKTTYPVPCSQVWSAVKETLNNPENYTVTENDDAKMHASYDVKHSAHVNISGTLLQRTNHVTLVPKGSGCEMQVVSNYSGWEHHDQEDFRTRVVESMAKTQPETPSQSVKPADTTK